MPYPLPSDTAGVSGITWKLIAVPDDPAYTRAALDRYSGISDVWNWGMEGVEPDSYLARQQWLTAVLLTLELWDMNPLETIIGHIDEIETLLSQMGEAACCYDMDPTDGDQYTDTGFDDDGPFPQGLVDAAFLTDTSDTAGWLDYKCLISNAFIDAIIAWLTKMAPLVDQAGLLIGGLAVLAGILSFVYVPVALSATAIAFRIVLSAGAVATVYRYLAQGSSYGLTTIATELETNRADLVCALYQGDGVDGSLSSFRAAVRDLWPFPIDELIVALGDSAVLKSFYGGRYDQEDVAAQFAEKGYAGSYDCGDCDDLVYEWDISYGEEYARRLNTWVHNVNDWDNALGNFAFNADNENIFLPRATLLTHLGYATGTLTLERIRFTLQITCSPPATLQVEIRSAVNGTIYETTPNGQAGAFDIVLDPPLVMDIAGLGVAIQANMSAGCNYLNLRGQTGFGVRLQGSITGES